MHRCCFADLSAVFFSSHVSAVFNASYLFKGYGFCFFDQVNVAIAVVLSSDILAAVSIGSVNIPAIFIAASLAAVGDCFCFYCTYCFIALATLFSAAAGDVADIVAFLLPSDVAYFMAHVAYLTHSRPTCFHLHTQPTTRGAALSVCRSPPQAGDQVIPEKEEHEKKDL